MKRSRLLVAGISPALAAYFEMRGQPVDDQAQRFTRQPGVSDLPIPLVGLAVIAFGVIFGNWIVLGLGLGCLAFGVFRVVARLLVPRRWVRTQGEFWMLTSYAHLVELFLISLCAWSLVRGEWTSAGVLSGLIAARFVGAIAMFAVLAPMFARQRPKGVAQ